MSEALFDERVVSCKPCDGSGRRIIQTDMVRLRWGPNLKRGPYREIVEADRMEERCPTCHGAGYVRVKVEATR